MSDGTPREGPVKLRYGRVGRFYDTFNLLIDCYLSRHRRKILRDARGKILEVGVGTGSSFKDYPRRSRIVAVDTSPQMLRRAN